MSSGTARAILLGDMVHCPLALMDGDFDLLGDHDQQRANGLREAYAGKLEGIDIPVAAPLSRIALWSASARTRAAALDL